MRKEYDLSKSRPNPYARLLKRQITIRLDHDSVEYFKKLADEMDIPYQVLINMYLRDCVIRHRKLTFKWAA